MWLELLQHGMWAVLGTVVWNWISNWTSDPVRRALTLRASSARAFWAEMRIGMAARRLRQLIRVQEKPTRAISDMIVALGVALLGGGYGLMLIILILYKQLSHLPVGTEVFSLLGPGAMIWMGFYRMSEASAELAQTEKMIARVRHRASEKGWDLDDAMVGLR